MRAILDGRVAEIKEFVGEIVKALPRPARIECSSKLLGMRKVVRLEFVCPRTAHALAIESREWSLWLKFAYSLAKTGFHVLTGDLVTAVKDAMKLVKGAYDAYRERERDARAFDDLMRQPFLLAAERDKLIEGLRKNGFFDEFEYDAQAGAWVKRGYAGDAGAARAAADAATRQVEEAKARAEAEERERAEAERRRQREAQTRRARRRRGEIPRREAEAAAAAARDRRARAARGRGEDEGTRARRRRARADAEARARREAAGRERRVREAVAGVGPRRPRALRVEGELRLGCEQGGARGGGGEAMEKARQRARAREAEARRQAEARRCGRGARRARARAARRCRSRPRRARRCVSDTTPDTEPRALYARRDARARAVHKHGRRR